MATKIIKAVFGGGRYAVTTKRTRTDYGQVLEFVGVDLPDTFECIFSNSNTSAGVGKKQIGSAQQVLIPDEYLVTGQTIYAWVLVHDSEDDGRHMYNVKIPVDDMPDLSPEEPTPVEQSVISQAITALNTSVDTTTQKAQEASDSADRAEQAADGIEAYVERAEAAQSASESARDRAVEAETSASTSAATATEKASEAISSATTASQSALTAEGASESAQEYATASAVSASASAVSASQASEHASTAGSKATEASGYASNANASAQTASQKALEAAQSASTATQAKTDAESAKTASQTAQTASESARDGAVSAKTDAESARDEAQEIADSISGKVEQIDSNTERIESFEDDRYKPYPTDFASGSIASFLDGADDIPLKSCIVQVEPVQEGSGDPSPDNVRPITGWTGCEIIRANANLWNDDWYTLGNVMTLITDETSDFYGYYTGSVANWAYAQTGNGNNIMFPNGVDELTVILDAGNIADTGLFTFRIFFRYTDGTEDYNGGNASYSPLEKRVVKRVSTSGKKCTGFRISTSALVNNLRGAVRSVMVSVTGETDIVEPQRTTYPITFPSEAGTIYGAYVDVINGELVVDRAIVDLGSLNLRKDSDTSITNYLYYATLPDRLPYYANNGDPVFLKCSALKPIEIARVIGYLKTLEPNTVAIRPTFTNYVCIKSEIDTIEAMKQFLNGVQLVYELAEPIHYPIISNQINSLYGQNNLWANTGDTEVEYRADTTLYIKRLTDSDTDMVADANIVSGQYFMVGNDLYKATVNIASGAQVIEGTNATKVSLAQALNEINA